jgi:hypothetical protein
MKCWGHNGMGQLGINDQNNRGDSPREMGRYLPRVYLGGTSATVISAGSSHTCAILENKSVKCWGYNGDGVLGYGDVQVRGSVYGTMGTRLPFVDLGGGGWRKAMALSAGTDHTCAILDDKSTKCWGSNRNGQLGLGDKISRGYKSGQMGSNLPAVDLGTGRFATAISGGYQHTCAILDDKSVKCWGNNYHGQLGLGNQNDHGLKPGQMGDNLPAVDLGTGRFATAISAGYQHTCAILDDKSVKCWGSNFSGQLGYGDRNNRGDRNYNIGDKLPAVDLGTGRFATAISAGYQHTCAILDDKSVKCWGDNTYGQLGQNDAMSYGYGLWSGKMGDNLPVVDFGPGRVATAISAGRYHTCVYLYDKAIKCWGRNEVGQLGLGDIKNRGNAPDQMGDNLPDVDIEY